MFNISRVEIDGFWGDRKAATNLYPDVNIFIGANGSGKTTFMDLLYGTIRVDLRILAVHEFQSITVRLADAGRTRTIRVTREKRDEPVELLRFQVGTKAFHLPIYSPEMDAVRHIQVRPRLEAAFQELRDEISSLVRMSSLSVHRSAYEPVAEEEYRVRSRRVRPPIDERLEELVRQLTTYQLGLAEQTAKVSSQFQKDVLTSILFNAEFDTLRLDAGSVNISRQQEDLTKAYRELGALTSAVSQRIATHFEALSKSVEALQRKDAEIELEDILPLPLLRRTEHIIKLLSDAESRKNEVMKPVRQYVSTFESFVKDKKVSISTAGEIVIKKGQKLIAVQKMSSGEKQLFVLLTETLLQRNQPFVFLADEPELSLHIEWQEQIISSLAALNGNAQVVVATHSPEIAAGWKHRLIDMSEVVSG